MNCIRLFISTSITLVRYQNAKITVPQKPNKFKVISSAHFDLSKTKILFGDFY